MDAFGSTAFLYELVDDGIRILKCRSLDTIVIVPETIGGIAVTQLGAYACSKGGGPVEGIWTAAEDVVRELPELSGERVTQICLPESLKKIGAYAFYNCENLQKLSCYSTTRDWGAGAFTGSTGVRFLDIVVKEKEKSCLKEILAELRQAVYVTYRGEQEARLIFPEFFEESVENTPARLLSTHTHGCGHQYRYCFEQSQFQFREYDGLFPFAQVQESEELVTELALGRVRYPMGLTEEHERMYGAYLKQHKVMAAVYQIRMRNMEPLEWLMKQYSYQRDELGKLIEEAGAASDGGMVSFLMDAQSRLVLPSGRKTFEL